MLSDACFQADLPCSDLERAKSFYADKLGLIPADEQPGRVFYEGRDGSQFVLFLSSGRASGSHTQMGFSVADIDASLRGSLIPTLPRGGRTLASGAGSTVRAPIA